MPNWVKQRVVAQDMKKLKELLLDENGRVDFNRVIPRPEELNTGSFDWEEEDKFGFGGETFKIKKSFQDTTFKPFLLSLLKDEHTQAEFVKVVKAELKKAKNKQLLAKVKEIYNIENLNEKPKEIEFVGTILPRITQVVGGFYNIMRYNAKDWYEWSIENWGTKWNACESFYNEDLDCIELETAWAMPAPVYAKVAEHLPVRIVFADEDLGNNCGLVDFFKNENGDVCVNEIMGESEELASDTWGYGYVSVYDKNGEEITDESNPTYKKANQNYFKVQEAINELMTPHSVEKSYVGV